MKYIRQYFVLSKIALYSVLVDEPDFLRMKKIKNSKGK